MAEITDEMVEKAIVAFNGMPLGAGRRGWWKAALSAVAPLIRAQALKEAGVIAFTLVGEPDYSVDLASSAWDDGWRDGWIVGASDQAEGARDAILALAEQATQTNKDVAGHITTPAWKDSTQ